MPLVGFRKLRPEPRLASRFPGCTRQGPLSFPARIGVNRASALRLRPAAYPGLAHKPVSCQAKIHYNEPRACAGMAPRAPEQTIRAKSQLSAKRAPAQPYERVMLTRQSDLPRSRYYAITA